MKIVFSSLSILVLLGSLPLWALPPVIYGEDNRREVFEVSESWQDRASAVAVLVQKTKITPSGDVYEIEQKSFKTWLEEVLNKNSAEEKSGPSKLQTNLEDELQGIDEKISFCPEERFTSQPVPGDCTGFLIAPDLLLTAGHCATIENFCEGYHWVFDFKLERETKKAPVSINAENIFSCKRVIRQELNLDLGLDFALVELDRRARGKTILEIEIEPKFTGKTNLTVIGSPSGLPLKVASEGRIRPSLHPFFFVSTLDTYKGNSGSPVFNTKTGRVEGILVRGEEDFIPDGERMCLKSKRCEGKECQGESVSQVLSIPEISYRSALIDAVIANDLEILGQLQELGVWMDVPNSRGLTPLMQSMRYPHLETLKMLLQGGADPAKVDGKGESALHHLAQVLSTNSLDVLTLLLQNGGSLEARNDEGETPLLIAARWLNTGAMKLLIEAGAEVEALNNAGEGIFTPFETIGDDEAIGEIRKLLEEKTLADDGRID